MKSSRTCKSSHRTNFHARFQTLGWRSKDSLEHNHPRTYRHITMYRCLWENPSQEACKVMGFLHGLCHIPSPHCVHEWCGRNPALLQKQWSKEASKGTNQAIVHPVTANATAEQLSQPTALHVLQPVGNVVLQDSWALQWSGLSETHTANVPDDVAVAVQPYKMWHPRKWRKLQDSLERIKKAFMLYLVNPGKDWRKFNKDFKVGKMVSFSTRKSNSVKYCVLCKNHGGTKLHIILWSVISTNQMVQENWCSWERTPMGIHPQQREG